MSGEIDLSSRASVAEVLDPLCARPLQTVQVETSGITFIDSSGLGLLVRAHRLSEAAGGRLMIFSPPDHMRHLLSVTKLDQLLDLREP